MLRPLICPLLLLLRKACFVKSNRRALLSIERLPHALHALLSILHDALSARPIDEVRFFSHMF